MRAVDGLAHPVDVGGVTRVGTVELAEGRQIRIGDLLVEVEDTLAVTGVSALQHLECRRVGIGLSVRGGIEPPGKLLRRYPSAEMSSARRSQYRPSGMFAPTIKCRIRIIR